MLNNILEIPIRNWNAKLDINVEESQENIRDTYKELKLATKNYDYIEVDGY